MLSQHNVQQEGWLGVLEKTREIGRVSSQECWDIINYLENLEETILFNLPHLNINKLLKKKINKGGKIFSKSKVYQRFTTQYALNIKEDAPLTAQSLAIV